MTAGRWEIDIPLWKNTPPLTSNELRRMHWRAERARIKHVRDAVHWQATKIPACKAITVALHYLPGDNRRRDASNLVPTQKPAVDALVRAGIVPDDCAPYVTELMPTIHKGPGTRRLWLEITETGPDSPPEVTR